MLPFADLYSWLDLKMKEEDTNLAVEKFNC